VPTTRRSETIAATPEQLWAIVGDPHHMPRWWPYVKRMETVDPAAFTQVLATAKGKSIRADFHVLESVAPQVRRWAQQLDNTPFERILAKAETEVRLEPDGARTRITLTQSQRLRGLAAFGPFIVRRATRKVLDEALERLRGLVEPSD
jgi:carbon monoxide dehydrogenase subunit G